MNEYYKICKFAKNSPKKKEKEKVSNETYQKVYEACMGRCVLMNGHCDRWLQLHHIFGRGKYLTDNPYNCVMLCDHHHNTVTHGNLKKYRPILVGIAIKIYNLESIIKETESLSDIKKKNRKYAQRRFIKMRKYRLTIGNPYNNLLLWQEQEHKGDITITVYEEELNELLCIFTRNRCDVLVRRIDTEN